MRIEGVSSNFISGSTSDVSAVRAMAQEGYTKEVPPEVILELSSI